MGTVWDRTVEVLQGRGALLARLAALYLFLPAILSAALRLFAPRTPAFSLAGGLVGLASGILVLVAVLAISAVASDPDVDAARAQRTGFARLGAALASVAVLIVVGTLAFLPGIALVTYAGATFDAGTERMDVAAANGTMLGLGATAMLIAGLLLLILSARISALFPVIVNERRGLGAIARSFRLTRGSTTKLIGVTILYVIVLLVLLAAVSGVVGLVARLLLGADAAATVSLVVAIASNVVTAGATVVQSVFYTRFYMLAREREEPAIAA